MNSITLDNTLPRVFVNERIPGSEVWNTRVRFERGNYYLVEATSGGGKSSMCSYIYGARTDYEGRILFDDTDTRSLDMKQWLRLRRSALAYLPQELSLFPELSARENIELKNRLTNHVPPRRVEEMLERLGIAFRADYPAGRLSIGQQQRVALIRSLCQPFDFILLDEPVSHLDPENNRIAAQLIMEEASRQGAGIISTSVGNHLNLDYHFKLRL
ncbi:MAG: ATP-binding cassette domain-containing protein [Bacteroidales bacterium]|nr:ATP-binding cassette domain-containing protein [Bacteroidales bacterium]MBD5223099.1 ATP-binding cassette domain-containing protein [Bacteroidales bacterium]